MNYKHGHAVGRKVTVEYRAWYGMLDRCYCETNKKFARYGGRGIEVCERWRNSVEAFVADLGERPSPAHSLDRYPNQNGNYEPGNVRWATQKEQQRNRTNNRIVTLNGEQICLSEAAERQGLRYGLVKRRLQLGWTDDRALSVDATGRKILSRGFSRRPL